MELIQRDNEVNKILNRGLLEVCPPGVNEEKWAEFRRYYNSASNLQINDRPAQLDIELNSSCNLGCNFCIHGVKNIPKAELGLTAYIHIIEEAKRFGITSLKLNYMNEPLLLNDLENYIAYALRNGMINVFFSTNGILLSQERAERLINSGLTKLFVSIDAVTEGVYFRQRNSWQLNRVVANVERFIDMRNRRGLKYPIVRVNFLKNKINQHEEKDFLNYWEGVADMVIIQEMYETIDKKSDLFINPNKEVYHCSFPFKQLVINHKGDILPCCTMHGLKMKIGNVREMTLREAWSSEVMKDLRELHKQGRFKDNPVCSYCING